MKRILTLTILCLACSSCGVKDQSEKTPAVVDPNNQAKMVVDYIYESGVYVITVEGEKYVCVKTGSGVAICPAVK